MFFGINFFSSRRKIFSFRILGDAGWLFKPYKFNENRTGQFGAIEGQRSIFEPLFTLFWTDFDRFSTPLENPSTGSHLFVTYIPPHTVQALQSELSASLQCKLRTVQCKYTLYAACLQCKLRTVVRKSYSVNTHYMPPLYSANCALQSASLTV